LATTGPDGSGFTKLLARTKEVADTPVWSPDGTRIAFTLFADRIVPCVMDADGNDFVRLRQEDGAILDWTPDGRRILVSADRSFLSVRPDGSGERVFLAEPPEGGRFVIDWPPDGDWIVMSTPSAVELLRNLYLMGADGSEEFQIGLGTEPLWRPETG
jgi:Tol biopolymer transport system component